MAAEAPLTSTVGDLRSAGLKDAHHVIQDAAVRDLPGYRSSGAPGVQLQGPSTAQGTSHYIATQVQRQVGGESYGLRFASLTKPYVELAILKWMRAKSFRRQMLISTVLE